MKLVKGLNIVRAVGALWKKLPQLIIGISLVIGSLAGVKYITTPRLNEAIYENLMVTNFQLQQVIDELVRQNLKLQDKMNKKGVCS